MASNKLTNAFHDAAAAGVKAVGFGLYVVNGLLGDTQSAEFAQAAGQHVAAQITAKTNRP